jgi:N-acyl-D-amino-acid deacylase
MTPHYDIIIRGGLVVDGTGADAKQADIAISRGLIQAVGAIDGTAAEEIDATGLLVTPGFIDLHTHYDGQAVWSQRLNPSSSHGVSTVILGNCGVGFAPCRPGDRELLCATMEGVEDIPGVVMKEGLTWGWESFPEYMDVIAAKPRDTSTSASLLRIRRCGSTSWVRGAPIAKCRHATISRACARSSRRRSRWARSALPPRAPRSTDAATAN